MKNTLLILAILISSPSIAQIAYGNQVGKKEVKKGIVVFENKTDEKGNTTIGFTMNGLPVGGQMIVNTKGETFYQTHNKKHQLDGTQIIMNKNTGSIELYTYRQDLKNGPAFRIDNGKIAWHRQYENGNATDKDYEVNHSADYYTNRNSASFEGFTMEKYKSSYAIGFFAYGKRAYPIIHVWNEGGSYYGQCIQGQRKEFGVYFYDDGSKYIGAWHNNYKEGLGFKLDKNGEVIEKGYYKKNVLNISI
jgi:hypothetical protein